MLNMQNVDKILNILTLVIWYQHEKIKKHEKIIYQLLHYILIINVSRSHTLFYLS